MHHRSLRVLASFLAAIGTLFGWAALRSDASPGEDLALQWSVTGNHGDEFDAVLKIANIGAKAWLPGGWRICFNSPRMLHVADAEHQATLRHVNGDFFELRPTESFRELSPGASCSLAFRGATWAIKPTDCPCGFYVVVKGPQEADEASPIASYTVAKFTEPRQVKRSAGDAMRTPTAATRFEENSVLSLVELQTSDLIVPTPARVVAKAGEATIGGATIIAYEPGLEKTASLFASQVEEVLGEKPRIAEGTVDGPHAIRLRRDAESVKSFAHDSLDAYRLDVDGQHGIDVTGAGAAGVFYGLQSLRALLPVDAYRTAAATLTVHAVSIEDSPRFPYRGMHLDVARNFHSKETVEKLLDLMAFYKLNRFQWHLTDDEGWRLEIKAYPELTAVGGRRGHTTDESDRLLPSLGSGPFADPEKSPGSGYYTQEDFVEVLRYATARHIEVIPELDFPGHARAAIKAMEAHSAHLRRDGRDADAAACLLTDPDDQSKYESVQMWRDNVVDVGREATYQFLDAVVGEIAAMYARAGTPLATIHMGGDEVPAGVWELSPACRRLVASGKVAKMDRKLLDAYFVKRFVEILAKHSVHAAGWEECVLSEDESGGKVTKRPDPSLVDQHIVACVWNNVWGWGQEDVAYKLASAGYDVVLSNATNLYFDQANDNDPEEPGYYWAAFVGAREPFVFNPLDLYQNAQHDNMGHLISPDAYNHSTKLTPIAQKRILGIQGQLWSELLTSSQRLEYMAFPRMIALAERAWAPASAAVADEDQRRKDEARDWNRFANRLGQRELRRLDGLAGGVSYRLPPPGAAIVDGLLQANIALPGLETRYTTDESDPTATSPLFVGPVKAPGTVKLATFDRRGRRSRVSIVGW